MQGRKVDVLDDWPGSEGSAKGGCDSSNHVIQVDLLRLALEVKAGVDVEDLVQLGVVVVLEVVLHVVSKLCNVPLHHSQHLILHLPPSPA